jgi:hypothetical protein
MTNKNIKKLNNKKELKLSLLASILPAKCSPKQVINGIGVCGYIAVCTNRILIYD